MNLKNVAWTLIEEASRIKTFMPRLADLEVTRLCNLKCIGCPRQAEGTICEREGPRFLTLDSFKEILTAIPTLRWINLMGDGEPLMNPEFNEIVQYAASKGIKVMFTTNGTLITEEVVRFWERCKVWRVQVSVDTADPIKFEEYRRGASFERVYESLLMLGTSKVPLVINFLLFEETVSEMPKVIDLCGRVGGEYVDFLMPIFPAGSDLEGSLTRPSSNFYNETTLKTNGVRPRPLRPTLKHCNFPFLRPQITIEGDLLSCCYMLTESRTEWYLGSSLKVPSKNYIIGNIFQEEFRKLWFGRTLAELRHKIKNTELPRGTTIPEVELRDRRTNIDNGKFSYCEVCLSRWGCACAT